MSGKLPGASGRAPNIDRRQVRNAEPDESDRKNIVEFIKTYNIAFPYPHIQSIERAIKEGRKETYVDKTSLHTRKDGGTARVLTLPQPFVIGLKRSYPYMFTSRNQLDWFLRNFPNFDLTR